MAEKASYVNELLAQDIQFPDEVIVSLTTFKRDNYRVRRLSNDIRHAFMVQGMKALLPTFCRAYGMPMNLSLIYEHSPRTYVNATPVLPAVSSEVQASIQGESGEPPVVPPAGDPNVTVADVVARPADAPFSVAAPQAVQAGQGDVSVRRTIGCFVSENNQIVISGKLSVITFLHEFFHAKFFAKGEFQDDAMENELQARRHSIMLFKKVYPKAFEALEMGPGSTSVYDFVLRRPQVRPEVIR